MWCPADDLEPREVGEVGGAAELRPWQGPALSAPAGGLCCSGRKAAFRLPAGREEGVTVGVLGPGILTPLCVLVWTCSGPRLWGGGALMPRRC